MSKKNRANYSVRYSALLLLLVPSILLGAPDQKLATDLFVDSDTGTFSPGIAVGEQFPAIRVRGEDILITDVMPLAGAKGLLFVANRSVDW